MENVMSKKLSMKHRPSVERLRELLEYNPETGILRWKVNRRGYAKAGDIAGGRSTKGYIRLRVDGNPQYAHAVAWAIYYGEWPTGLLDHENTDGTDNRIS